jgi:spoIIIJ-associated protein
MEEKELTEIEAAIKEFFVKAGSDADIKKLHIEKEDDREVLMVNIKTKEANIFIGKQGLVLSDIQLLLRKIIKKRTSQDIFLNLDIDDYKKYKEDYLRELAQNTANEAIRDKEKKELLLPSSFDRRMVHLELSKRIDVKVESIGEGENRKIVIDPIL